MLGKLLKYDMKKVYNIMLIFYAITALSALITKFFMLFENSPIFNLMGVIFRGVTIAAIFNVFINNLTRLWVTFKQDFYGDESYLIHTLPVKKEELYFSKFITAVVTALSSSVIIIMTLLFLFYEDAKSALDVLSELYGSDIISFAFAVSLIYFLEVLVVVLVGYTGILLGYRADDFKLLKSFAYGIAVYFLVQGFIVAALFISLLFSSALTIALSNNIVSLNILKKLLLIGGACYAFCAALLVLADIKIFKKGVNVE